MVTAGCSFLCRATATLGVAAILIADMTPAASAFPPLDSITNALPNVYGTARGIINAPGVSEEISGVLNKEIDFLADEGEGEPGFNVPGQAPKTNQFLLPAAADGCTGDEGRSLGLVTTVPGPAGLPLPGALENQLGFISTGSDTKQLAKEQNTETNVYWVNVANGKYGKTTLENNGINAEEGPDVVSGTADTGKSLVIAAIQGGITTQEEPGPTNYNYTPTAGVFPVGLN